VNCANLFDNLPVSQDEEAGHGGWFWNEQVGSYRPPGALYCRECGVLIQDYDHLCPWTGTGIGRDK
jgi:DHHC palmitoyltransferase